jgi:hypothetical protein
VSYKIVALILALIGAPVAAQAGDSMLETFDNQPQTRWRFFADTVMGGVSSGQVVFKTDGGQAYAHLSGTVSTQNNGGFIQIRHQLDEAIPSDAVGVRLIVRGNDQDYFVHLRTRGTVLPWQYYQGQFHVTAEWREIRLPFTQFKASGKLLRTTLRPQDLKSVAIVAFGRDYEAAIDVKEVGFY